MLGNFIDYDSPKRHGGTFRLESLMKDLDENGMEHPILLSPSIAYSVSVGHQRVWYAHQRGYTHIDCYEVPDQEAWQTVFNFTQSDHYWKKRL